MGKRITIQRGGRMKWVKQPSPYVRGKIEKVDGWVINHEKRTVCADPDWAGAARHMGDLSRVLHELDRLEGFPENLAYICEYVELPEPENP